MTYSPCILIHNPLAFNELFISPSLPFKQSKPQPAFQTVDCGVIRYIPPRKNKGIRAKVKIISFKRLRAVFNCILAFHVFYIFPCNGILKRPLGKLK